MRNLEGKITENSIVSFAWGRFKNNFPTILFYTIIFFLILMIFGVKYSLVASTATLLFEVRFRKSIKPTELIRMIFISLVLCLLAYAATQNAVMSILLNFTVPFLLVFLQSSQFVPKGHFGYAMTFAFLELIPLTQEQFKIQFVVVAFSSVIAALALLLYGKFFSVKTDGRKLVNDSLVKLAEILDKLAAGDNEKKITSQLYEMEQAFQKLAYESNHHLYMPDRNKHFYNMFALLIQRAMYLVTDGVWSAEKNNEENVKAVKMLAYFTRKCADANDSDKREKLKKEANGLFLSCSLPDGRVKIFYRSYLYISAMLLRMADSGDDWKERMSYRIPWKTVFESLPNRLSTDSFEIRFAIRLAVVMSISFTVSLLWDFEHTYWFPLHAFLLVQPSYEESAHRMVTRPIGTIIGCLLVHLIYPLLPGMTGIFVFSVLMVAIMYCCTPGTWVQPIFATASAVTMALLTVEESAAVQLRIFYLFMAVALVMVVNKFCFPSKKEGQFRRNIKILLGLQRHYWGVVQKSLRGETKPEISGEILAYFHMIYNEAATYLKSVPESERKEYSETMNTLWNMFSEVEQVICLVQSGEVPPDEYGSLYYISELLMDRIDKINSEWQEVDSIELTFKSETKYVIDGYLNNLERLYNDKKLAQIIGV